jgi:RND family efflux transporter MFP subunit
MKVTARRRSGLCAVLASLALLSGCQQKKQNSLPPPTGEKAPPPQIPQLRELAVPAQGEAARGQDRAGTGSLHALHKADLGPKQTGVLTAIAVEEGDRVKRGQLLFKLDADQAQLAIAQAKAAHSAAHVQLDSAKLDFDRTKALRERGSIPEDALDQARARYDAARIAVEQADMALSLAQKHAGDMVVTSPIDGIVTEKRMNVGETATLMPPSVVLVVQDIDQLELRARLPENALRTVREQSELTVTFPAVDETRKVKVKRIAPTVDLRTRTIEIIAAVDNKDHRLKAGMMAQVAYGGPEEQGAAHTDRAEPARDGAARAQEAARADETRAQASGQERSATP